MSEARVMESTSNVAEAATDRVALLAKLRRAAEAIPYVQKRGVNDHHGYRFAQAVDVVRDVRSVLLREGIVVVPAATKPSHYKPEGSRQFVTTVELEYRFYDVDTGHSITVPWVGAGADTGGDKGLYKAFTGGLKYALMATFLLPMTEDPEHDALTPQPVQPEQPQSKDAERPPAPTIPLDRAKSIADMAVKADLAVWEEDGAFTTGTVLAAKLAEIGVDRIGALNADTAETMEAWLRDEIAAVMAEAPNA